MQMAELYQNLGVCPERGCGLGNYPSALRLPSYSETEPKGLLFGCAMPNNPA